jgi:uncharacterized protein (UPF0548 family)
VLLFAAPSEARVQRYLDELRTSHFTYSEVGATSGLIPPLYTTDHNRVRLGTGPSAWSAAQKAIRTWEMFNLGWIHLYSSSTPIIPGENVAVLASYFHCYWLNACRIVYTIDEDGPVKRFGFAYGTLEDHAESGEERFLVEWNRENDEVWYDLLAFSRPNQFLSRMGYPFTRRAQKKFAADSKAAMVRAVAASGT